MTTLERIAAAMRDPDAIVVRLAARGATIIADVEPGEPRVVGAVFDLGADDVLRSLRVDLADALEAGGHLDAAELLRDEPRLRACTYLFVGPRAGWRDAPSRGLVLTVRC